MSRYLSGQNTLTTQNIFNPRRCSEATINIEAFFFMVKDFWDEFLCDDILYHSGKKQNKFAYFTYVFSFLSYIREKAERERGGYPWMSQRTIIEIP
ncbi:hypothetical protein DICVIV_08038 [Dictyocaulus viviparus]|uniref:Uncharacterized protein n=1 Tax=Dictyocaulus viviparus TaxID=29172 RepID=A0A0D8XN06_DICVI|nr:hypothetical protein DICVIV_08038 [Dictyocaulus viviparus]